MSILTFNSITTMQTQMSGQNERAVVQCSNMKVLQDCMRLDITDGVKKTKAIIFLSSPELDLRKVGKPFGTEPKYLIQINDFTTYEQNGKIYIQILAYKSIDHLKTRSEQTNTAYSVKRQMKTQERLPQTEKKQSNRAPPISSFKIESKTQKMHQDDQQEINAAQMKNFEKISDLYTDMPGWQLLVRVLQKSYRQFNNRAGNLTKIFEMTLIDRTGTKIEGVMFGDNAKEYHQLIKTNGIYRMSKGQIRQDTFNKNRGDKHSRFNIIFNKSSMFVPLRDIPQIPRGSDSNVQLKQLLGDWNYQRQFDIVGILLSIGEERIIQKEDRSIFKKSLVIGDPMVLKSIEVVIWNKDLFVDPKWIGRTIKLKNFRLHNYKDTLSLSSIFKSDIRPQSNHQFVGYQKKYQQRDYQLVSQERDSAEKKTDSKDKNPKSIRQLDTQISLASLNQTIYSDFDVYVSHMSFKGKWSYEACNNPKCKRSAEPYAKCLCCGHYNDNTLRVFMLPIQISDYTGSIWTTAFSQFAQQIFQGITVESLLKLNENELKEQAEKRMYQQYKVRISTKKDHEGNVKHNIIGRVGYVSIEKSAISNVERIKKMMGY